MLELYTRIQSVLASREQGQTLAEYGLILALIAVLCVGALGVLQVGIDGVLTGVAGAL